jgi:integrase
VQERRFFPEQIRRRDVLLSKVIDDHLDRAKSTLRHFYHYRRYGRYWKDALGTKALREILPADIERYVAERIGQVKPATVNRELAFLKRVFNVAIANQQAETNPVRQVKLFRENNQRVRFLSDDEEQKLREGIGEEQWPLVAFALHTGLRQSEQFGLRWQDVDFATGIITIERSKHGGAHRLPMNDHVRDLLRSRESRLKSRYVFPSQTGESAIDVHNYMSRVFGPALAKAKVENFRWHDLRHTFASRLVMAGVDLRTVQELLGHKTITMTLRYSHLSPAHQLDAVQRLISRPTSTSASTCAATDEPGAASAPKVVELQEEKKWAGSELNTRHRDFQSDPEREEK